MLQKTLKITRCHWRRRQKLFTNKSFSPCGIATNSSERKSNAKIFRIQRRIPWRFQDFPSSLCASERHHPSVVSSLHTRRNVEVCSLPCVASLRFLSHTFVIRHFSFFFVIFFPIRSIWVRSFIAYNPSSSARVLALLCWDIVRRRELTTFSNVRKNVRDILEVIDNRKKYILLLNIYLFVFQTSCCRRRERESSGAPSSKNEYVICRSSRWRRRCEAECERRFKKSINQYRSGKRLTTCQIFFASFSAHLRFSTLCICASVCEWQHFNRLSSPFVDDIKESKSN